MAHDGDEYDEDDALWHYVTRGIRPLGKSDAFSPHMKSVKASSRKEVRQKEKMNEAGSEPQEKPSSFFGKLFTGKNEKSEKSVSHDPSGLDKRTDERLRRGQLPIEARIDLHGKNKEQAKGILTDFIHSASASGKRCVLVITGKGKAGEHFLDHDGVLKKAVPGWLSEAPLRNKVLKYYQAKPKDGGDGALYVYLKRDRS